MPSSMPLAKVTEYVYCPCGTDDNIFIQNLQYSEEDRNKTEEGKSQDGLIRGIGTDGKHRFLKFTQPLGFLKTKITLILKTDLPK